MFLTTNDLPAIYKKSRTLPIEAPRNINRRWERYGRAGGFLGALLVIIGLIMIPVEVSRIIEGSLNRGTVGASYLYPNYNANKNAGSQLIQTFEKNFVETDLAQEGIVPFSATAQPGFSGSNFPIQDKYIWPWSHPALLFSLVAIVAGGLGILAAYRKTYTAIYAFFATSLLSFSLSIFMIAYFSVIIYWHLWQNSDRRYNFTASGVDYILSTVMLAFSVLQLLVSLIASIYAALAIALFKRKAPLIKEKNFL